MPTMTRVSPGALAWMFISANQVQWVTRFVQIVEQALQYQRAAQLCLTGTNLVQRKPVGSEDTFIQLQLGVMFHRHGGETGALISDAIGAPEEIEPRDASDLHAPAGLLQGLAAGCLDQAFTGFQVPCGLVEDDLLAADLLDHEVPPMVFHDGGDSNMRCKTHDDSQFQGVRVT